jgi:hypothetical protein
MKYLIYSFGSIFVVIGLALVRRSVLDMRRAIHSASWPTTSGIITQSAIKTYSHSGSPDGGGGGLTHAPDIEFSYTVGGSSYTSRCIRMGMDISASKRFALNFTSRYLVGRHVRVSYDPANPASAVLEPGNHRWSFAILGFSCCFVLFGAAVLILAWIKQP